MSSALFKRANDLTAKQALQIFKGSKIKKSFTEGVFTGEVQKVERDMVNGKTGTVAKGLHFLIRYEDDDLEHITLQHLQPLLTDKEAIQNKLKEYFDSIDPDNGGIGAAAAAADDDAAATSPQKSSHKKGKKTPGPALNELAGPHNNATAKAKRKASENNPHDAAPSKKQHQQAQATTKPAAAGSQPGPSSSRQQPQQIKREQQQQQKQQKRQPVATQSRLPAQLQDTPSSSDGIRTVPLPGHLIRIELIDFMCHHHFLMDFAPHVTFVSGTNGSGKSAVLQALQCALGVKARETGRAGTFKNFVRTGAHEAIIRVTIANRPYNGFDPFQFERYGDSITIERRIHSGNGTSQYKLKDVGGKVIATRRDDLDAMLSTLGINAANPVAVVTQDTARNFLAGSSTQSDKQKYDLYMEATQLSTISSNLVISKHHISLMGETVEAVKEDLKKMKENVDSLKMSLQSLGALDGHKKELVDIEAVAAWMAVDETESAISTLEKMLEEVLPQRLEVAKSQREDASRAVKVLANRKKDADDFMQQFLERSAEIAYQVTALKAAEKVAKIEMLKAGRKVNTLREGLLNEQERKRDLEASIAQMGVDVSSEASTAAYLHQLSAAQAKVEDMEPGLAQNQEEYHTMEAAHNELVNQLDSLHQAERSTLSAVREMEAEMTMVQAAGRNRIALFGGEAALRLRQAVDKAVKQGVFHRPPIGPVGMHLQLKDKGWGLAIDSAIGSKMNNYLVHDGQDSHELIQIINSLNIYGFYRPDVCIQSFETPLHYIPENRQPNRNVLTIYRVLNCDPAVTPQIINYLVDHESIEHKALALNRDQGRGLKGGGVKSVFFPDGEKLVFTKSSEIIMPRGPRAKPRVGGAQKDQMAHVKASMKAAQDTVNNIKAEIESKEQELARHNKALTTARVALAITKKSHFEASREVELLMSQPPVEYAATQAILTAAANGEGMLTQQQLALPGGAGGGGGGGGRLEEDILNVTQLIIDLGQQLKEADDSHHEAQAKHAEADAGLKAAQEAIIILSDDHAMKNNTIQEDADALQDAQDRFNEAQKAVQELEKISNQRLRELADARQSRELLQEAAEQVSTREAADEAASELKKRLLEKWSEDEAARYLTVEVLSRKITKLQAKINNSERRMGGSTEDLEVQLQHAQIALDTDGRRKQGIIATYKMLRAALLRRERKLNELDQQLEAVINQRFNHYMRKKRHNGEIVLDREKQSLSLGVRITSEGDGSGMVKDLKQLSGGERSFTTVAFTLALGGQTDMPFRAMDEFDVFMDAINRRMAMQSLFGFAREHDELQFVFLTPQDLSAVEAARLQCEKSKLAVPEDFVKVVQMRPARQNATS